MKIKVFIIDPDPQRLEILSALMDLSDEIALIGSKQNFKNIIKEIGANEPNVFLIDMDMPKDAAMNGCQLIKTNFPKVHVLLLTAFNDAELVVRYFKNGANGVLLKTDNPNMLLQSIVEAHKGDVVINPSIAKNLLKQIYFPEPSVLLTVKEEAVLAHLANGNSYKQIAELMDVKYHTVNFHIKNIYSKLNISSVGEAIAYYYKNKKV
jgi:DNA-binding NarL/FixJ family response regulator